MHGLKPASMPHLQPLAWAVSARQQAARHPRPAGLRLGWRRSHRGPSGVTCSMAMTRSLQALMWDGRAWTHPSPPAPDLCLTHPSSRWQPGMQEMELRLPGPASILSSHNPDGSASAAHSGVAVICSGRAELPISNVDQICTWHVQQLDPAAHVMNGLRPLVLTSIPSS